MPRAPDAAITAALAGLPKKTRDMLKAHYAEQGADWIDAVLRMTESNQRKVFQAVGAAYPSGEEWRAMTLPEARRASLQVEQGSRPFAAETPSKALTLHIPGAEHLPDNAQWKNRFEIRSETSDRKYVIAQNKKAHEYGCSCPGWRTQRHCKHLRALGLLGAGRRAAARMG